ncbi:hypothetical protein [Vulgatibacter sp.]|uniref:hypothetical protein n=1 Tax=Vulgatibacter sp. TaxID=1971226 RepID=UPI00356890DF
MESARRPAAAPLPHRLLLAALLLVGAAACGADASDDVLAADPFTAAIPGEQMLALAAAEDGSVTQGLGADANDVASLGRATMRRLDDLRGDTHAAIRRLVAGATPTEITRGNLTCRVWEADATQLHWQLVSCRVDARRDRYGFVLRGRPLASTAEADDLPVFAGEGARLPDFDGARRGAGRVGYNFDHLATLTGVDAGGQLGLGYRVAGRARQLLLGLRDVHGPDATEATTALFRFGQVLGVGGRFVFLAGDDFLTRDAGDELVQGQDGIDELARVAMAWNAAGAARTLATACGGTVGEGSCVHVAQCWTAGGDATHAEVSVDAPVWNETACPALTVEEVPGDEAPGSENDESGAPVIEEPAPSDEE